VTVRLGRAYYGAVNTVSGEGEGRGAAVRRMRRHRWSGEMESSCRLHLARQPSGCELGSSGSSGVSWGARGSEGGAGWCWVEERGRGGRRLHLFWPGPCLRLEGSVHIGSHSIVSSGGTPRDMVPNNVELGPARTKV
jgi:hypothetical protein